MAKTNAAAPFKQAELASGGLIPVKSFWIQAAIIILVGAGLYVNSIGNWYALDDEIIIHKNRYVMDGTSGISDIMGKDAYASFYESMGVEQQLSGGRYRPLSIVSFAIETQLFIKTFSPAPPPPGADEQKIKEHNDYQEKVEKVRFEKMENQRIAPVRHGFQVFYYAVSLLLLFYFLRNFIFRFNTDIAFIATLLFAAHPIHTEVIANVKSRDEIFSLIFVTLTFIFYFRYDLGKEIKDLAIAAGCLLLALLSKEYALAMIFLPIIGVVIFHKRKLRQAITAFLPMLLAVVIYGGMRYNAVGLARTPVNLKTQDILNDPYLNLKKIDGAKPKEKGNITASKINRLDDYLVLLVFPHPLSSDYSYRHFPYSGFNDPMVWLSFFIYAVLIWWAWTLWRRRHPLAFALAIYFGFFALIANIFMDIGATMGERLIYHSSLGFVMVLAWGIVKGAEWLKTKNLPGMAIGAGLVVVITGLYGFKTISRNPDWHDDYTLFSRDVKYVSESALTNGNAGARYMDKGIAFKDDSLHRDSLVYYAKIAEKYLLKAVEINPKYVNSYLNLGLCYYYQKDYPRAAQSWSLAEEYFHDHPLTNEYAKFFTNLGFPAGTRKDYDSASVYFGWAAMVDPWNLDNWNNYAGTSFMALKFAQAKDAFNKGHIYGYELKARIAPNISLGKATVQDTLNVAAMMSKLNEGFGSANFFNELQQKTFTEPRNFRSWLSYGMACTNQPAFWATAESSLEKALELKPGDPEVLKAIADLEAKKAAPPPADPAAQTPPPPDGKTK
ncbi:MAG: hypothetical protein FD123_603 [Bacteroidetes bacterium]|nr:MAG: hypothetical protein FD123_603 [Bacteroidota bacterium]